MGFLTKYRDLRLEQSPEYEDEVEFNFGRAFNQIGKTAIFSLHCTDLINLLFPFVGLLTHAVKHYERVLQIAERRMQNNRTQV
jgi:general transcription factor 3C polypeptide 3 (transcription factor C subunit 4)